MLHNFLEYFLNGELMAKLRKIQHCELDMKQRIQVEWLILHEAKE